MAPVAATQDPSTPESPATTSLVIVYRTFVDILEDVPLKARVGTLRPRICAMLKDTFDIDSTPATLRLFTLKAKDGVWPTEAKKDTVTGRPTPISRIISSEFADAPTEDCVHLRVEIAGDSYRARADEVQGVADSEASDVETAVVRFNSGCVRVVGGKRKLLMEDGPDVTEPFHTPFSAFTETQVKRIMTNVDEKKNFKHPRTPLPAELLEHIKMAYKVLVGGSAVPWGTESEAQKRRYIDAVLSHCVYSVNSLNPSKEKLNLHPEYPITCNLLTAAGSADWLITRGERMLVVIEAKQCDIKRGQYQLLAMMEALRIMNKKLKDPVQTIKAICTDFQNWLFVERAATSYGKEMTGAAIPEDSTAFPETLIPICERVYNLLINL